MADSKALQGLYTSSPRTPGLPKTAAARKALEADNARPQKTPQRMPRPPPQHHQEYDDDEEEENKVPDIDQREPNWGPTLSQLLDKWDQDLSQLRDTVSRDLDDYRKRLGIRQLRY
nr:MAG: E1^E4 [Gammapapillomavirus sp.]